MKVFLAGVESLYPENLKIIENGYNLISFFTMNKQGVEIIKKSRMFLLDSGAYTFLANSKKTACWEDYIEKYANFIKQNNIKNYFELDIDSVIGYENVKKYRNFLEKKTGQKCIPVWHKSRGIEEFRKMCSEYSYVAIGGIVAREITKENYKYLPILIREAHKRGAKVHGLGFTSTKELKKIHFDTVDSTNWSYGRYGHHWVFTEKKDMVMYTRMEGKRCKDVKNLQAHNLLEWKKFQEYAEAHL
jgi:hypothetical protein